MLREIVPSVLTQVLLTAFFTMPLITLTWYVMKLRQRRKTEAEEPFSDLPLRPAGESLRLKIERLAEAQQDLLMMRLFLALTVALMAALSIRQHEYWSVGIFALWILGDIAWKGPKIVKISRQLWAARLGFTGERVVGEHLNQLLASGYYVFHDIPFEAYNIDHVIVGPTGVFAIETKTRRKPKENGKKIDHRVHFDGEALRWPRWKDTDTIDQAAHNVRSLSHWLSSATGEPIRTQGIVTIPGWWIDDSTQHSVWVLNPKRIKPLVEARNVCPLSPPRIQAIAHQLTERCRLKKD